MSGPQARSVRAMATWAFASAISGQGDGIDPGTPGAQDP
jgi:hypothetical protein